MIALVPPWAHHYLEFWETVKKRNIWFIRLRYLAALTLLAFTAFSEFILEFSFSVEQLTSIGIIAVTILVYNLIFHSIRDKIKSVPRKFNVLHFSLLQMLLDLICLALLIYFTGGIESPLVFLFIFHMIIGSLILPGRIVYFLAVLIILLTGVLSYFEYAGIIQHHTLNGFLGFSLYDNPKYIIIFTSVFGFVILVSVYLTNGIAKQLYKLEQELLESFDKLETAEKSKQKYIMAVVHEIKTPLTAVISYLSIINGKMLGEVNPEIDEKLKRAFIRSEEAVELINNVLRISKLRLLDEVIKEEFDIDELIQKIVNTKQGVIESKNLSFKLVDSREEKEFLLGDKFLFELVISNLVGNAIKYTPANGKVEVVINNLEKGIEISINDDGIGIPKEDLEKLFGDFFRASNIKGKGIEGTGLGLSIVKQIIEKHEGTISIDSPSGIGNESRPGTSVKIKLPGN